MSSRELVKSVVDEEVYKFNKAWIADIARRRIWLASFISRVSSSAEPSTGLASSSSAMPCGTGLGTPFLLEVFERIGQLAFFLLGLI